MAAMWATRRHPGRTERRALCDAMDAMKGVHHAGDLAAAARVALLRRSECEGSTNGLCGLLRTAKRTNVLPWTSLLTGTALGSLPRASLNVLSRTALDVLSGTARAALNVLSGTVVDVLCRAALDLSCRATLKFLWRTALEWTSGSDWLSRAGHNGAPWPHASEAASCVHCGNWMGTPGSDRWGRGRNCDNCLLLVCHSALWSPKRSTTDRFSRAMAGVLLRTSNKRTSTNAATERKWWWRSHAGSCLFHLPYALSHRLPAWRRHC